MGKNLNPADAFRKAQRKKELKKNKAERVKARDFSLVKKDTTDLENAIKEFEESRSDPAKLAELKAELEKINKKKAEYVAEHPEMRKLVYRRRREGEPEPDLPLKKRNLFKKNGLPRHPERSIYYDPVMNPFGVAPPGMPYVERPLLPGEVDSDAEMEDENEIMPLPSELPPGTELVTSDDEIPMPEGFPPGKEEKPTMPVSEVPTSLPPNVENPPLPLPLPSGFQTPNVSALPPPPPPPAGFPLGAPPLQTPLPMAPWQVGWTPNVPPPPPPPPVGFPSLPYTSFPPFPPNAFPQPPPNFFPRKQSTSSLQDPLSSLPHQTFQAHRASQLAHPHSSLPPPPPVQSGPSSLLPNPSLPAKPTAAADMAAATVTAEPQLRDLKKEATAFVPAAVKRKKAISTAIDNSSSKIDAAPSLGPSTDIGDGVEAVSARPDLVSALKSQFGPVPEKASTAAPTANPKSDYEKFLEEMGDILGSK